MILAMMAKAVHLATLLQYLSPFLNKKNEVQWIYLDSHEAFDVMLRGKVWTKLEMMELAEETWGEQETKKRLDSHRSYWKGIVSS